MSLLSVSLKMWSRSMEVSMRGKCTLHAPSAHTTLCALRTSRWEVKPVVSCHPGQKGGSLSQDRLRELWRARREWGGGDCSVDREAAPEDVPQVMLTHVDGVGDGQVVDDAVFPKGFVPSLPCQPVVEGGQPWALEGHTSQDLGAQDGGGDGCEAPQGVPCPPQVQGSRACRWHQCCSA